MRRNPTKPRVCELHPPAKAEKQLQPQEASAATLLTHVSRESLLQAEASDSDSDGCLVSADDSPFMWDDTRISPIEANDTGINGSESPQKSESAEESNGPRRGVSLSGNDAHEEAPTRYPTTSKGKDKERVAPDCTEGITVSSMEATAPSKPKRFQPSTTPATNPAWKRSHKPYPFLNALENEWNVKSAKPVEKDGASGPSTRVPTSAKSKLKSMRQEGLSSPKRRAFPPPPEVHTFPDQAPPPTLSRKSYGGPFRPPKPPPCQNLISASDAQYIGRTASSRRARVMRRPAHRERQHGQTRMGRPPPELPRRPANIIPRQCVPYRGLRTTTDRWDEVMLPFHIARISGTGDYQQLFIFDVDDSYIYAFLLLSDIANTCDESELEAPYDDVFWGTSVTEGFADDTIVVDDNPSLDQGPGLVSPSGHVVEADGENGTPNFWNVYCSECRGRNWIKDPPGIHWGSGSEPPEFDDICCATCYGYDRHVVPVTRQVDTDSDHESESELYDTCCSKCQGRGWVKNEASGGRRRAPMHRR